MTEHSQREVVAFLSDPASYGAAPADGVARRDTHVSIVFLAGERAYKLKRAVRLPYLDFSTADARRAACEAEVAVNRRAAPNLYEGVAAVTREPDGRLRIAGAGPAVDWLVVMRRFDESMAFDRLAEAGRLDRFAAERLADVVAGFHAGAPVCRDAGWPRRLRDVAVENRDCLAAFAQGIVDAASRERWFDAAARACDEAAPLLAERAADGRVRLCHGDLHLRNIFADGGDPVLFDAIEFCEAFTRIDVLYDLAFLAMDLDARGLRPLASILLNRYLDVTGDAGGLPLVPLFLSLRAGIRAHVEAAAARTEGPAEADRARRSEAAARCFALACGYLEPQPPRLIAIGGLSGSGKSRLARELAPEVGAAPGARVIRTDTLRKRLAGVAPSTRLAAAAYTEESSRRIYRAMMEEAAAALAGGASVIADAVFARPEERAQIARVAADAGAPFQGLWLRAPQRMLEERVGARRDNPSDATPEIVRLQLSLDLGPIDWPMIATDGLKEAAMEAARRVIARPARG